MPDFEKLVRRARVAPERIRYARRDAIHQLADEGLFDLEYYRAQFRDLRSAPSTLREAVTHYVESGRAAGLAYHPFIEPEWWDGVGAGGPERGPQVDKALVRGWANGISTSPLLADAEPFGVARELVEQTVAGGRDGRLPGGLTAAQARSEMIRRIGEGRRNPPNRGSASAVDWSAVRSGLSGRVPGRVSVLVPTFQDWVMTTESVRVALAEAGDADIEIIVIENGSRPAVFRMLTALFIAEPRVTIIACDTNTNFAGGMNRGIADSTGEYIVLLNNDAVVSAGWLPPLIEALDADPDLRGVQPLLLYPKIRRIQAAGTMFLGEGVVPWHFLAGHPVEDAHRVKDLRFNAVTAAIMALRTADLVAVEGFDEGYANGYEDVDLCLRMLEKPEHHFKVVLESLAVHPEGSSEGRSLRDSDNRRRFFEIWRGRMPAPEGWRYDEVGLRLAAMRPIWFVHEVPVMLSDPQIVRPERLVESGPAAGRPCLRWVLALTTEVDAQVVADLTESLSRLGQEVVTIGGGNRFTDGLDDVLVAFEATAPWTPRSATLNVLVVSDLGALDDALPVWEAVIVAESAAGTADVGAVEAARSPAGSSLHSGVDLAASDAALLEIIAAAAELRGTRFSSIS